MAHVRQKPMGFAASAAALLVPLLALVGCAARQLPTAEDVTPPSVRVVDPTAGARVETATPSLRLDYQDDHSGVHVVSFRALINGADYSTSFDHDSRGATGRIPRSRRLPLGENRLEVELADRAGNVGHVESVFTNASGGWLRVTADPGAEPVRHVELVLDASGSMRDELGASTRMEVARQAIHALLDGVPPTMPLGLRVFRGCDWIRQVIPIGVVNKTSFAAKVDSIEPDGGTPIVASLLASFDALNEVREGQRVAVLLTDGGESCSGDLQEAINRARDAATRVIVIGFDIGDQGRGGGSAEEITAELRRLAVSTGGAYFDAREPAQLRTALERSIARLGYFVLDGAGERVADGELGGAPLELPAGTYEIRIATIPAIVVQGVEIGRLTDTPIRLRRTAAGVVGEAGPPTPARASAGVGRGPGSLRR